MSCRRAHERYFLISETEVIVEPFGSALLRDISVAGARIEHSGAIPVGHRVRLIARLGPGRLRMHFEGSVVWCTLVDTSLSVWTSGVQFASSAEAMAPVLATIGRSIGSARSLSERSQFAPIR
jgi:Tfp pilus assembly protein PilZ